MLWCVMIAIKPLQQYFPIVASWTGSNFKPLCAKFYAVTIQIKPPLRTLNWNVHVFVFHKIKSDSVTLNLFIATEMGAKPGDLLKFF